MNRSFTCYKWFGNIWIDSNLKLYLQTWIDKKTADTLHHHGGYKALQSHVLLTALKDFETKHAEVKTPYLLLHGAEDKICSPEGSKGFHKVSSSDDKTLTMVESALHNLYLEKEEIRDQAVSATMDWIKQREQTKEKN